MAEDVEKLRYFLKRVTANLHEARQRLQEIEAAAAEPVAIIGMSCRFPGGVRSPEDLWDLLASGTDAISGFPADRGWEDVDGQGGFLYDVAEFDPEFFGISPREAMAMDPQQRLLLQVSWEALERSGIDPVTLRGSRAGVFAGASPSGYGWLSGRQGELDGALMTGNATSVLSGRVAYTLGLEGPAVTVDTACSSALVSLHLAASALRAGECSLAMVGGVFVAATPVLFADFSRQLGLSPTGRCHAFGEGADGMGVAEGAGMLVVERLSDARRHGHPVLAVVRGSAVNSDGASNGLTAPNGPSQQRVIWAALAAAGVRADQVDAVEAHGTGTSLGDPIEAQALLATYGQDRPEGRPLYLGSVKSNIGHTQQAAGTAALIKMVMALTHQELPRTLHADQPSSHVDWSAGEVRLLAEPVPWPAGGADSERPRRAGVSGFGMSGTNVHVILEEAPPENSTSLPLNDGGSDPSPPALLAPDTGVTAWLVSGRTAPALAAQAARLARWVAGRRTAARRGLAAAERDQAERDCAGFDGTGFDGTGFDGTGFDGTGFDGTGFDGTGFDRAAVARSLATTRSAFEQRAVVIGTGTEELTAGLGAIAAGQRAAAGVLTGAARNPGKLAFVFAGQGTQWAGMGRELAAASPVFAARLAECEAALSRYVDWSLTDVLSAEGRPAGTAAEGRPAGTAAEGRPAGTAAEGRPAGEDTAPDLDRVEVTQPALWAVMVSLAAVWQAAGVTPDAVTGHSQGEIAAATVAGILTLDDAARLVTVRSRALAAMDDAGGMLSVVMPADAVRELLASRWEGRLHVAAVNSPAATVVSGDQAGLAELQAELAARRVLRWPVPDTGFVAHSARLGELAEVFDRELAGLRPQPGQIPMYSSVTGQLADGAAMDAGYWLDNVRREVAFSAAVETLAGTGHRVFVEVSPHPVLTTAIAETLSEAAPGTDAVITGTLDRAEGGARRLLTALATLHVAGVGVDWDRVLPPARRVDLPTYAFQNQRYWISQSPSPAAPALPAAPASASAAADGTSTSGSTAGGAGSGPARAGAASTSLVSAGSELVSAQPANASPEAGDPASWRYRVTWTPVPTAGAGVLRGTWVIVVPARDAALSQRYADAVTAGGAAVFTVPVPAGRISREGLTAELADGLDGLLGDEAPAPVAGVLSLLALDESPLREHPSVPWGMAATLGLVQALGDLSVDAPLWVATSGAVAAVPGEALTHPVQAHVWGMGRAAGLEHLSRWGGLIDLPSGPDGHPVLDARTVDALGLVLAGCGEDQVAIRPAGIMARRLSRARLTPAAAQPGGRWTPRGTALVTGGTGAVGGHVARWLAGRGAPALVLTSRSGPAAPGAGALAAELAAAGATVQVTACDVGSRDELAGLIDRIAGTTGTPGGPAGGLPPLTGVYHTAVALADGVLDGQEPARMALGLSAKSAGATALDELTAGLDLDAFVLFSSIAGTFGGAGQGAYAGSNAYLDALAENRRSRGLPALAVAWGPWAGGGIADANEATRARLRRNQWEGLMDPALAIRALDRSMDAGTAVTVVMDVDWPALISIPGAVDMTRVPFLRDLPEVQQVVARLRAATAATGTTAGDLATRLAALPGHEQLALLTRLIQAEAAAILGHASPDAVDPARAFSEMGFDSLTSVELRNRLTAETGLKLPATLLFDYPTPAVLAVELRVELTGGEAVTAVATHTAVDDEPIAIVGMGCRYPGGVGSPEELWELLAAGRDAISGFPADRGWDEPPFDGGPAGPAYAKAGGFVHDAAEFDPGFFGISPREATAMDPQQRLLLEISWEALERAGIDPAALHGSQTGVFTGGYATGYGIGLFLGGGDPGELEGHLMTGGATAIISGRVAYALGLEGPAVTVDTACSSSLVALHMAAQALRSGEATLALAGGVTIMATPWEMAGMARQSGLSSNGRCKAFGAAADGMGMAEGAGVLVVERLSDAIRNGHDVLAVVTGSAINSDGASNGLTAPNGPSQQRVIRAALARAGTAPADVDVVEAHGTGTALGDPIEAQALMATYGRQRQDGRPLLLGSVKSNIGHTQAAAGVAGIIKIVMALRHEVLPATLHAGQPSPHIDWTAGDVRLLTEAAPWPAGGDHPRRAGVSSFGLSGTNAHVIIEEAPALPAPAPDTAPAAPAAAEVVPGTAARPGQLLSGPTATSRPVLGGHEAPARTAWLLSAKTAAGLAGQAARLAEWATARPGLVVSDVAWSLATTRSVFGHRAVVTGETHDELVAGLRALTVEADGETVAAGAAGVVAGAVNAAGPGAAGPGKIGFLFSGQGSQRAGMAAGLHAASPVFAAAFDEAATTLEELLGVPVAEVALGRRPGDADGGEAPGGESTDPRADDTLYAQPCLFAVQAGLVALLAAAGITPDAVAGHSVGEVAAAYAAGVLSLGDACTLVAARARGMQALPGAVAGEPGGRGAMGAIAAPEAEVARVLADPADPELAGRVSVAAVNGPSAVVISGDEDAVRQVAGLFADRGTRTRMLRVSHAFHSARMDPMLAGLDEAAAALPHAAPRVPWAGALTGALVTSPDPAYWSATARQPVRFADALTTLAAGGVRTFLEIGPDGTLSALGPATVEAEPAAPGDGPRPVFVPLQRRDTRAVEALLTALATVHVTGVAVDWAAVLPAGNTVALPTYAFQRGRYWAKAETPAVAGLAVAGGDGAATAAEVAFWAAVEGGDATAVANALAVDTRLPLSQVLPALASWRRGQRAESATAPWRYRVRWAPVSDPGAAALPGTWLLVTPPGDRHAEVARWCAGTLSARGAQVITVPAAPVTPGAPNAGEARTATRDGGSAHAADRAALADSIRQAIAGAAGDQPLAGVLSLLALDERPLDGHPAVTAGLAGTLTLIQALGDAGAGAGKPAGGAPLWVLTRGAVSATSGDELTSPAQAQAWGLGRSAGLEHQDRWGGLIDLPPAPAAHPLADESTAPGAGDTGLDERTAARLAAALAGCGEDQVAIRAAGIMGRRLARVTAARPAASWTTAGRALVTGGTGALGARVARWLAERGAPDVVLTSRTGPGAVGVPAAAAALAGAGTGVSVYACDSADRDHLSGLLQRLTADQQRLTAVFHTAGASDDGVLDRLDAGRLQTALAAKAGGARYLDELTAGLELDAFVLFSSVAGTIGGAGQGNYAAANAYLDALAENRRARGLAAASVAWGPWAGGGMAEASEAVRTRLRRGPMAPMDPALAIRLLGPAIEGPDSVLAVMDMDWAKLAAAPDAGDLRQVPLLRELPDVAALTPVAAGRDRGELASRLAGLTPAAQDRLLTDLVRTEAAAVLGHASAAAVEPRRAFSDLGFDSLTAVELRNRLEGLTGLRLPATIAFDYPAAAALAAFLRTQLIGSALTGGTLTGSGLAETAASAARPARDADRGEPIAIVGIGCRFPGGAAGPQELWQLLAGKVDAISGFPADRGWDEDVLDAGIGLGSVGLGEDGYTRSGGFVADATGFDAGFFGISPREAAAMDPQQRVMLEVAWEALEQAGIDPGSLSGSQTGVFTGGYGSGYEMGLVFGGGGGGEAGEGADAAGGSPGPEGYLMTGNATSVISGRVAYTLGLEGPAVTVDTACSSSLVALHLAAQALRARECTMALAGGVTVIATPGPFIEFSHQQGLAGDGRCKPFSADADGIVWGEGAGALVLMRLSEARRRGHDVLAVITGSAVNSDGASNGLSAPNGPSQQRVIRAALASAGLSPADVDAVEAHGTGTSLGDPIEAQALLATYGQGRADGQPLWLGAVKSNLGHTGAAAGVAGVIKMVLALRHEELPPTLHAENPSPHVDWDSGQVRLLTEPVPWPAGGEGGGGEAVGGSAGGRSRPRRAGVSAFGISGTNAHLIIEEPPAAAADDTDGAVAADPDLAVPGRAGEPHPGPRVLAPGAGPLAWAVSGQGADALTAQATRLSQWTAAHPDLDPAAVAWSLATTRSAFGHRAVVIGSATESATQPATADVTESATRQATTPATGPTAKPTAESVTGRAATATLADGLSALVAARPSAQVASGVLPPGGDPGKVVFVFPGQGSQWAGMGLELAVVSPVFAERLAQCSAVLEPFTGWRLEDVLGDATALERVEVVQPALWAVMVSLAAVWRAAGVEPDAVAGHSQGEIAAAVVAGILSLEDGARVVALRSRALTALSGRGAMASLALPAAEVRERLEASLPPGRMQAAAVNGPTATVVSGDPDAVAELVAACVADDIRARVLPVDYASHGPQVAELEKEILAALDGLTPSPAQVPMISALTGEYVAGPELDAGYWYASLRAPVEFERSVRVLAADGHGVFVEASPHAVVLGPISETLADLRSAATVTGTLRRGEGGAVRLLTSLAEAWTNGVAVDWAAVLEPRDPVALPTYAFQHQRYWGPSLRALQALRSGPAAGHGAGPGEARFWAAVEDGDLQQLAQVLDVDGQRPFSEVLPALASWRRQERDDSVTASWRYRVTWEPAAQLPSGPLSGAWLLVTPPGGRPCDLAAQLAQAMTGRGAQVTTLLTDPGSTSRDALSALIGDAVAGQAPAGVVSLLALSEAPLPGLPAVPDGLAATLALIQALGDAGSGAVAGAVLWVLTRGAVATAAGEALASPVQAQAWGLGRTAALEHPERWAGLIDLPADPGDQPGLPEPAAARLCDVLAASVTGSAGAASEDDQLAIRPAGILTRRLVRAAPARATRAWAPRGSVLITGGTGAIGRQVARLAASRGASRVVLASRSGAAAPGVAALAAELAAAGTQVTVAACDSADHTALSGLLGWLAGGPGAAGAPPLSSVFHAAGVAQNIPVADLTPDALADVLAAKAAGADSLDTLTTGLDLDAFVLFSSGSATWGSGLQAGYGAANSFLDAVAASRKGRGLTATSVAWGMWGGGGMTDPQGVKELSRRGLAVMEPRLAVAALAQALDGDESLLTVADIDWARFAPAFTVRRASPLISAIPEVVTALAGPGEPAAAADGRLAQRLAGLPRAEQDQVLTDLVRAETAAVLGHAGADAIDPARAFKELGLDSLTALDLRNRLAAATGRALPATLVYDHPNPAAIAAHLWGLEFPDDGAGDPLAAELDRFESLVSGLASGDEARGLLSTRLKRLLAKLDDATSQDDGQVVARAIESASDDEIFNFIHTELGR